MVSLLSFFQSKKKTKRSPSSPTSPTSSSSLPRPAPTPSSSSQSRRTGQLRDDHTSGGASASSSSSTGADAGAGRPRPARRFLSLRRKSSNRRPSTYEPTSRRASSELSRKRSQVKSSKNDSNTQGLTSSSTTVLPQLDLGFEVGASGEEGATGGKTNDLGLLGVGEKVDLTTDEVEVLDKLELNIEDVQLAWTIFGQALRESNLNTFGLMLPHRLDSDTSTQLYLLSLYALTINPALLPSFPTIAAQFAQPSSDPSKVWTERLKATSRDIEHSNDLAEVLRYTLRRLHSSPSSTSKPFPLIDPVTYTSFVQAEHASSYPLNAYSTLLIPKLQSGVPKYLEEIFEVWSAIATHADENTMTSGRLAYLLGWWALRIGISKDIQWEKLYKDWQVAGRRIEHLLYAWIRHQSTRMQMPTRLLEVVDSYPFGESTASSEHLPLPPPSSFLRQTLRITLASTVPPIGRFRSPEELLKVALSSKQDEDAVIPHWAALKSKSKDQTITELASIVAEGSLAFLRKAAQASAQTPPSSPNFSAMPQQTPISTDTGPLYRPFSTVSAGRSSPRTRAFSQDAAASPPTGASSRTPSSGDASNSEPSREVKKQTSLSVLPKTGAGGSVWDDFSESGFSDSPNSFGELGLAFSPQSPPVPLSPSGSDLHTPSGSKRPVIKKRTTFQEYKDAPKADYTIQQEEVIEIDDTFLSFVEDAQLDPRCVSNWPPFTLVRLASPISNDTTDDKPIEWLLVTVVHRPPPPPPEPEVIEPDLQNRPTSPASSKQGTPRGFRDIANSFKRSSSFQSSMGLRRSFFGTSGFSLSKHVSDDLGTLPESQSGENRELRAPPSAQSLTPTEYTLGEMGEIIKIPSAAEKAARAANADSALPTPPKEEDEITIKGEEKQVPLPGLCNETSTDDWRYHGEGAEHIVFSYHGDQPSRIGKVLRIRKSTLAIGPTSPTDLKLVQDTWRDELLPKLLSPELLPLSETVNLGQSWAKELLENAESIRPEKRRNGAGKDLAGLVTSDVRALLMDDTTINEKADDKVTVAVEIKPKWGFLPSAEWISPPEAIPIKSQTCRFCLHSHLGSGSPGFEKKYCPLDLYSGDQAKMTHAVEQLWGMWAGSGGKGNNWKMFIDGDKIKPDQVDKIPVLAGEGSTTAKIASLVIPALESSKALHELKSLQSTLDPTDISNLAERFAAAFPDASLFDPLHIPSPTAAELEFFVELYLSSPTAGREKEDKWTLRQRLVAYSLSAIFKDCSVFVKVTLHKLDSGAWAAVDGSGKVKIVDLDLKPIQNMGRWYERDSEIWRHWLNTKSLTQSTSLNVISDANEEERLVEKTESDDGLIAAETPVRQKTVSGLTALTSSEGAEDGASTRAVFVPTPDMTRASTPLPSAVSVSSTAAFIEPAQKRLEEDGSHKETATSPGLAIAIQEPLNVTVIEQAPTPSALGHIPSSGGAADVPVVPVTGDAEVRQRTESMATSISDEPSRKERSLAPSPSPSVANRDLPADTDVSAADAINMHEDGANYNIPQLNAGGTERSIEPEAEAPDLLDDQPVDKVENPVANTPIHRDIVHAAQHTDLPDASHSQDQSSVQQHLTSQPIDRDELSPEEPTSPAPVENEAFFTPAETPLVDLQGPIFALANTLPSIPKHSLPNQVEITEHKGESQPIEDELASSVGTPKLRIIPIEDATPKHESIADSARALDHEEDFGVNLTVKQPDSPTASTSTQEASLTVDRTGRAAEVVQVSQPEHDEVVVEQSTNDVATEPARAADHATNLDSIEEPVPQEPSAHKKSVSSAHVLELGEPVAAEPRNTGSTSLPDVSTIPVFAVTDASEAASETESGMESAKKKIEDTRALLSLASVKDRDETYIRAETSNADVDDGPHTQLQLEVPHHDLDTISEDGESSIPTTTEMSRDNTDEGTAPPQSESASDRGDEWVEVVDKALEETETPKATKALNLKLDEHDDEAQTQSTLNIQVLPGTISGSESVSAGSVVGVEDHSQAVNTHASRHEPETVAQDQEENLIGDSAGHAHTSESPAVAALEQEDDLNDHAVPAVPLLDTQHIEQAIPEPAPGGAPPLTQAQELEAESSSPETDRAIEPEVQAEDVKTNVADNSTNTTSAASSEPPTEVEQVTSASEHQATPLTLANDTVAEVHEGPVPDTVTEHASQPLASALAPTLEAPVSDGDSQQAADNQHQDVEDVSGNVTETKVAEPDQKPDSSSRSEPAAEPVAHIAKLQDDTTVHAHPSADAPESKLKFASAPGKQADSISSPTYVDVVEEPPATTSRSTDLSLMAQETPEPAPAPAHASEPATIGPTAISGDIEHNTKIDHPEPEKHIILSAENQD